MPKRMDVQIKQFLQMFKQVYARCCDDEIRHLTNKVSHKQSVELRKDGQKKLMHQTLPAVVAGQD